MGETDPRIVAFRTAVNDWKRETFFPELVEENDPDSIDRRIEEAKQMYFQILQRVNQGEKRFLKMQTGGSETVTRIVETLGPEEKWTEPLLDQVRSSLITDLLEYPLTFNPILIEQFKKQPNFPTFQ